MTQTNQKKPFPDEETLNQSLIKVLKEIRINMDLSQSELEIKLGVGKEHVSRIERGKLKVSLELLRKYTLVFNISISDIILRAEKSYGIN